MIETRTGGIECLVGQELVLHGLVAYGEGRTDIFPGRETTLLELLTQTNPESDDELILGKGFVEDGLELSDAVSGFVGRGRIVEDHRQPNGIWLTNKRNIDGR